MSNRDWKKLEEFVANIHSYLMKTQGQNIEVKRNDRVKDTETGRSREVDIAIRTTFPDGTPVFIDIECRKRKAKGDTPWIEELISRKKSIGADIIIAVSSVGFTRPAIEKARMNNIHLHILDETIENFEWFDEIKIPKKILVWSLKDLSIFSTNGIKLNIKTNILEQIENGNYDIDLVENKANKKRLNLITLGSKIISFKEYPKGVNIGPLGGVEFLSEENISLISRKKEQVRNIDISLQIEHIDTSIPVKAFTRYGKLNESLVEIVDLKYETIKFRLLYNKVDDKGIELEEPIPMKFYLKGYHYQS